MDKWLPSRQINDRMGIGNGKFYLQENIDVYPNGAVVIVYRIFHHTTAAG